MSSNWSSVIDRILAWVQSHLPGLFAAYQAGKNSKQKEVSELRSKLFSKELELEYKKNEVEIEKKYADMSDSDIIESINKRKQ